MPRFFYTLLLWLLLPYAFFHLAWRALKQPEYLKNVAERFGFYGVRSVKPVIWLHTVSVGETRAAASLVKRLQETYPHHRILITLTTPTGREAAGQLYGDSATIVYLPYDYPFAVRRFLNHFKPQLGVLLETEIWFNLIHACHDASVPLLLLNARLSEKSASRYARYPHLARQGLTELSAIAAQSREDAERLTALGAHPVAVMGNLKFDIAPPAAQLALGAQLREKFGAGRKVFLAASTRNGEEELLLDAISAVKIPGLLTVIVPRHPQRFDEVAALLERRGCRYLRRSGADGVDPATAFVLGDSMGELFAYYAACDIALIGGSLLPFGGQNLIEASACGKPVIVGPHTYNFTEVSALAVQSRAAVLVKDPDELAQAVKALLSDPARCAEMGRAGREFVERNQGATARALVCIRQFMPDGSEKSR